jgi:hypothetical protein
VAGVVGCVTVFCGLTVQPCVLHSPAQWRMPGLLMMVRPATCNGVANPGCKEGPAGLLQESAVCTAGGQAVLRLRSRHWTGHAPGL